MKYLKFIANKCPWLYPLYFYTIGCLYDYIIGISYSLKLKKQKKTNEVYVLTNSPIGDTIYSLAYLESFKKKCDDLQITVLGYKNRVTLYSLYRNSFDNIKYIDLDHGKIMCILRRKYLMKLLKKYAIYSAYPYFYQKVPFNSGETTLEVIKNELLDIGDFAKLNFPIIPQQAISAIENFEEIKSKVVIINPYSTSMYGMQMKIYEDIASFLVSKGFVVFTNAISTQKVINNTRRLDCSIIELYEICNNIPLVISTRSGIIDFLISSSCNFYIYYFPIEHGGMRWINNPIKNFYNYFRLDSWGTDNVTEHIYETENESLNHFINYFNTFINGR